MGVVGGGKSMRDRKQDSKSGSKLGEIMRKICNIKELMCPIICFTLRFRTCLLYTNSFREDPIFGSQLKRIMAFDLISWKMLVMKR